MTHNPYVLEVTASATIRVLVYADDIDTADDILNGRFDEMTRALRTTAGLPDEDSTQGVYVHYDGDVRPAYHHEAADDSSTALNPGLYTYDTCDHEEHYE